MHCQTLFNHFKMMRSHVIVYLCELFPTEIDAFQNEDHINAIKFDAIKHQIVAPNFNSICHINWQHAIHANRQIENKQPNNLFRLLFQNVIKNRLIERFLDVFRIFFQIQNIKYFNWIAFYGQYTSKLINRAKLLSTFRADVFFQSKKFSSTQFLFGFYIYSNGNQVYQCWIWMQTINLCHGAKRD